MPTLAEFVEKHTEVGACCCGKCIDAPPSPEKHQPCGHTLDHTLDLTFFKVAAKDNPSKDEMLALVKKEHPDWLDGVEHSYMEIGVDMLDQGMALKTIGLGALLGVWECMCPETMMPHLSPEIKKTMAGRGLVCLKARKQGDSNG